MNHELEDLIARMSLSGFSYSEAVRLTKRAYLKHAMKLSRGNQCDVADQLSVHRNTVHRLLQEAQLDPRTGKSRFIRKQPGRVTMATGDVPGIHHQRIDCGA